MTDFLLDLRKDFLMLCKLRLALTCFLLAALATATVAAPLKINDPVPNFELTDQDSQKVSFDSLRGKGVIVSFLFTRCPYPDKCPMIGKKLSDLAKLIEKTGEKQNLRVMAITLDPAYDKPEVLKAYTQGFDKKQKGWSFLTGSEDQIAQVAGAFGVTYWKENGIVEHNMRTAFIDPKGRLRILKSGSDWLAGEFAAEIKAVMESK
jgi:protein SCO1/2